MSVSEKEAFYHIKHSEQEYEWGNISKELLRIRLTHAINDLSYFDYDKALSECKRVKVKYNFSIEFED